MRTASQCSAGARNNSHQGVDLQLVIIAGQGAVPVHEILWVGSWYWVEDVVTLGRRLCSMHMYMAVGAQALLLVAAHRQMLLWLLLF